MKEIKNITITEESKDFKNDSGEVIDYMEYQLEINGKRFKVKPVNGTAKVRLTDAFENVKDSTEANKGGK